MSHLENYQDSFSSCGFFHYAFNIYMQKCINVLENDIIQSMTYEHLKKNINCKRKCLLTI